MFCLMGTSKASAWGVEGSVVCEGTAEPVANVQLTFTQGAFSYPAGPTDASGLLAFHINGGEGDIGLWGVTLNLTGAGGPASVVIAPVYIDGPPAYGVPYVIAPIEVDASLVPACAPPPPACPELEGVTDGQTVCLNLGNPRSECAYFGLVPAGKDDGLSGSSFAATKNADLALVKAAGCYKVFLDVTAGDTLTPPGTQAISHVTYCTCE
jgi:hypothetical protein